MKRIISFVLAMTLLFSLFVIPASAISTNVTGMTYYNTILVTVEVETRTDFDTYNFGEYITDVCVVGMEEKELAVEYKLILKVSDANEDMIVTVIEDISEIPIVKSVTRNNLFYRDSILELNHSDVMLKVGDKIDLNIEKIDLPNNSFDCNIIFQVDVDEFDLNELDGNALVSNYYIYEFWPYYDPVYDDILYSSNDTLRNTVSDDGWAIVANSNKSLFESADALSKLECIKCIQFLVRYTPTGALYYEDYATDFDNISIETWGGVLSDDQWTDVYVDKTATITALAPGEATVTLRRGGWGTGGEATCNVKVYSPGDLDNDFNVTAAEALTVLQASVNKITLTFSQEYLGDADNDGVITAEDALKILQISVGKE